MTPKERSRELVDEFYIKVHDRDGTSAMNEFEAKQCALIAVDEIIKYSPNKPDYEFDSIEYFNKVKQEIEKL